MKKRLKRFSFLLIITCCFFVGTSDVKATSSAQARAVGHGFDETLNPRGGIKRFVYVPSADDLTVNGFRYIRVKLKPGTGGGDNVDIKAIAGAYYNSPLAKKTIHVSNFSNGGIIDFKAKNAPTRSDATYTVDCSQPSGITSTLVTNDYCVASPSLSYGIELYNGSLFGGNAHLVGEVSFEN